MRLVLLLLSWIALVFASRGDRLSIFQDCVSSYIHDACDSTGIHRLEGDLPFHLRALGWTCASDGDYQCQQAVTQYLINSGSAIEQFHGKWPFIRVLGIQEPASVVFSILNGYVHYRGLSLVERHIGLRDPMRTYYILFAYIGMNAWLWSTVFHIRDFPSTEKMDYFSAGTYVLYGLFYSPIRVFRAYNLPTYGLLVKIWGALCFTALSAHIGYLTFITFDYGYNMLANVIVGSLHGLVWLLYTVLYHKTRPSWVYKPALIVAALAGAMSLELFDFLPWLYAVDAHALWHLATVPITWYWYHFLLQDAAWEETNAENDAKRSS